MPAQNMKVKKVVWNYKKHIMRIILKHNLTGYLWMFMLIMVAGVGSQSDHNFKV